MAATSCDLFTYSHFKMLINDVSSHAVPTVDDIVRHHLGSYDVRSLYDSLRGRTTITRLYQVILRWCQLLGSQSYDLVRLSYGGRTISL